MSETPKVKRFYEAAEAVPHDGGWAVALDGRKAKTPRRAVLAAKAQPLAGAMAEEWNGQGETLDMGTMPLTRLQGMFLDADAEAREEWARTILAYARSDLLCYRAEDPALAKRQADCWQPFLDAAGERAGGRFAVTEGVIAVAQPDDLIEGLERQVSGRAEEERFALALLTQITGSAVLAVALIEDDADEDAIFAASRLDETYQAERWGVDAEAAEREEALRADFDAVLRYLRLAA